MKKKKLWKMCKIALTEFEGGLPSALMGMLLAGILLAKGIFSPFLFIVMFYPLGALVFVGIVFLISFFQTLFRPKKNSQTEEKLTVVDRLIKEFEENEMLYKEAVKELRERLIEREKEEIEERFEQLRKS